jgi:hypothetical protein
MSHHSLSVFDHDWPLPPLPPSRRESAFSTSTGSSGSASAILGSPSSPFYHTPISPATTPGTRSRVPSLHDDVTRLQLSPAVTMYVLNYGKGSICQSDLVIDHSCEIANSSNYDIPTSTSARMPQAPCAVWSWGAG